MKVAEVIASELSGAGVDTVFGVLGRSNLVIVDELVRAHGVRYFAAAREDGAVLMANAFGRLSGRLGVGTVGQGPGLTNALTAIEEAARARTPMLLVAGDTPAVAEGIAGLQDIDQRSLVATTGAGFQQLRTPATAVDDIAAAVRRAEVESRPIVLNIPGDLQEREADPTPPSPQGLRHISQDHHPDPEALDQAVGLIASAKRPIVLAGSGAARSGAREALVRLADTIGAPLATTLLAKDLFDGHPFNIGIFGGLGTSVASEVIGRADCVVAFGASLNEWTTAHGNLLGGKRVVHCDASADTLRKSAQADVAVQGDARVVADAIVAWLAELNAPASAFRTPELEKQLAGFDPRSEFVDESGAETVDIRTFCIEIDRLLPADRTLVTDFGHFTTAPWQFIHVPEPTAFLTPHSFGSIGMALASAVGAAIARPDRLVAAVVGDGGFMMSLTEFGTACRYELPIAVFVMNDNAYGAEYHHFLNYGRETGLSLFNWPDLAPVAQALGGDGVELRSVEDIPQLEERLGALRRPLLVDVRSDPAVQVGEV